MNISILLAEQKPQLIATTFTIDRVEGRAVRRNPNTTASPVTQTAMRGLITNPSKEHLFACTRHRSTFSEN